MKATFTISIEHDTKYRALSNMPALSVENVSSSRSVTKFQKSVPMPTYLVAYIISDFKHLSDKTGIYNNITVRYLIFSSFCYKKEVKRHLNTSLIYTSKCFTGLLTIFIAKIADELLRGSRAYIVWS